VIAVFPRLHASLGSDLWPIGAGARIRLGLGVYWRGISIAIEVITALATLGLVGALPPLLNAIAKPIRSATARLFRPLVKASPH
jgi:hypothetical protein